MNLCYRGVRYNTQSTHSLSYNSSPVLKYRGVSYYSENLGIAEKSSHTKLTYRGVVYCQDGSEAVKEINTIPTLKSALT
ncbi:MAG: DUF4278 domain-containing protein [Limnoraphis robusta]|jgi:hypothetical protein